MVISLPPGSATIQSHFHATEIETMTYNENHNLDIDPAMIILGLGYATCLLMTIAWVASFTF